VKIRCSWCKDNNLLIDYHDNEWGKPVFDDQKLFELLMLEIFQAGLSWEIILKKRKNIIKAFDSFDLIKIANYDSIKISDLMANKGIIKNKLKILAAISNARSLIKIQKTHGKFFNYINNLKLEILKAKKEKKSLTQTFFLSKKISSVLRNDGVKFIGPTIIDSFLMSSGFINGHEQKCYKHSKN
tara:strand:- start:466 stop:1020 length:555 start_codon:yes stop_codon:yes gene_type:complete